MENPSKLTEKKTDSNESRLIPFFIAGIVCFAVAFILGAGGWYLLGTNHQLSAEKNTITIQSQNQNSTIENQNVTVNSAPTVAPTAAPTIEIKKAPAGELPVEGGVVELGGGETNLPAVRVSVEPFAIGETEVTNTQYAEFVEETKHKSPIFWKDNKFSAGQAEEPVVGVSWADANDYCEWLSKKSGATVRLPNEAEWELAARGKTSFKFPWGNEWNDEAVESAENRKVHPVKSYPKGRSPVGAYDMVGNVWEWTSDLFVDEAGQPDLFEKKTKQRVIKGGSVYDDQKLLAIKTHFPRPENKPSEFLGFRYVIIRQ